MEVTVRELLAAAQAERKTKLHAGRVDMVLKVGDLVLLRTKELLDAADIGKLRPRWDCHFRVTACPSPTVYTLALPRKMRCSPAVNVDRLKPFTKRAGAAPAPRLVSDAGQEGEHEVELLLNRRMVHGIMCYLVRWRGHTSEEDEWQRAEELAHCQENVAEYDATAPRRSAARRADPAAAPASVPLAPPAPAPAALVPPAGFRLADSSEGLAGTALVGKAVRVEGWVRGTVARSSRTVGFSHVMRYGRASALGSVLVPSLLDAASHGPGCRWVLLLRLSS